MAPMFKLIGCEIFFRELCALVASAPHRVDLEFLPKGLHDLPSADMRARVQAAVDAVPAGRYERILLGFGLCNNGVAGVRARATPLIVPRSHDCIGLFLGSPERYREVFEAMPGTYFLTPGWIERGEPGEELRQQTVLHRLGLDQSFEELVRQFGEENARYIVETLAGGVAAYHRYLYIRTGCGPDDQFEAEARRRAAERGWALEVCDGDPGWLRQLVFGPWPSDRFLEVPPGAVIRARPADGVMTAESAGDDTSPPDGCG
ncbi:MAG: DUF1638 domain-containing protein [Kiritimatiellae bacterium]|nr:DUF1638 domain-containing protein [Kiritimatiellia bacterium]